MSFFFQDSGKPVARLKFSRLALRAFLATWASRPFLLFGPGPAEVLVEAAVGEARSPQRLTDLSASTMGRLGQGLGVPRGRVRDALDVLQTPFLGVALAGAATQPPRLLGFRQAIHSPGWNLASVGGNFRETSTGAVGCRAGRNACRKTQFGSPLLERRLALRLSIRSVHL